MKIQEKTILLHRIHYWASLTINVFVATISYFVVNKDFSTLITGILVAISVGVAAVGYIDYDMHLKDTSYGSIIFKYVCVLGLSCIIVYRTYVVTSLTVAIVMISIIILEAIIALLINHRYKIINAIKQKVIKKKF